MTKSVYIFKLRNNRSILIEKSILSRKPREEITSSRTTLGCKWAIPLPTLKKSTISQHKVSFIIGALHSFLLRTLHTHLQMYSEIILNAMLNQWPAEDGKIGINRVDSKHNTKFSVHHVTISLNRH